MDDQRSVLLDSMSGFDFEEFVADLLSSLGYGKVERVLYTQDGGRDILIRAPSGLLVVECKHQPKTGVGRPVVQKLHSAVVTSDATKGILVTSGHFTPEALEYASKLKESGTEIEMVDRRILADMASRAHVSMVSRGEKLSVWTYPVPTQDQSKRMVCSLISSLAESYPRPFQTLLTTHVRSLSYRPAYLVSYRVDATFETSVGVIHRERADAAIMFDGNSGDLLRDDIVKFLETEKQRPFEGTHEEFRGHLPTFLVDATTLQSRARSQIKRLHTKRIGYLGRNNVSYSKICEPGERDIYIDDIRQVYLPLARVAFSLVSTDYIINWVQGSSDRFLSINHDIARCRICNQAVSGHGLVCDACGKFTHSGGFFLKSIHGFRCGKCKRTTCRTDGHWRRRFLIWRELLCLQCTQDRNNEGLDMRILAPIR